MSPHAESLVQFHEVRPNRFLRFARPKGIRVTTTLILSALLIAQLAQANTSSAAARAAHASALASSEDAKAVPAELARIQERALSLVGVRYRFGGNSPKSGFDCSGFVQYVLRTTSGVRVGRTAASQAGTGHVVEKPQLRLGDLVFFNTQGHRVSHVGIYLGHGQFVHAPSTGEWVRVDDLNNPYWQAHYATATRLKISARPMKHRARYARG